MKTAIALLLLTQLTLIGFSAAVLAGLFGEPSPGFVGFHVALIAGNLLFGAVNVRGLCR